MIFIEDVKVTVDSKSRLSTVALQIAIACQLTHDIIWDHRDNTLYLREKLFAPRADYDKLNSSIKEIY